MDDFQPEDELKPDTSDRPAPRGKKPAASPKLPISKQHLMIAVGILVLLLLVLGIGAALNNPSKPNDASSGQGSEKNIDLSSNPSVDNSNTPTSTQQPAENPAATDTPATSNDTAPNGSAAQVGSTDTNGAPAQQPTPSADQATAPTLPVAAATLDRTAKLGNQPQTIPQPSTQEAAPRARHLVPSEQHTREKSRVTRPEPRPEVRPDPRPEVRQPSHRTEVRHSEPEHRETLSHRPPENVMVKKPLPSKEVIRPVEKPAPVEKVTPQPTKPAPAPAQESVPGKGYTLQLSAASREDTLHAWAKQQNLSGYRVYKTSRNGQPWYVLTTGNYSTPAEAKSAISSLPDAVKAKSPWVKPMSQVRKESAQ